jgi:putative spermidine/putrescine transport system ATP-binding protein
MGYLDLIGLHKQFGKTPAVWDFSLSIDRGEFISLLGPSGCGKTTTLRMIAGLETPDSGKILLDGRDLTSLPPNKRGTGMVFQAYALFPNLNVRGNIAFGLEVAHRARGEIDRSVSEMLKLVRLEGVEARFPRELSGGQQQRVALARALAVQPHLLLLDEPLSALDAMVRVALRGEIRRIQSELGITTVYVTHDQEEALSISDRVAIMHDGRIEQVDRPEAIYRSPRSRFVAAFVGTGNQFIGQAVDSTRIQCQHWLLKAAVPDHLVGKEVVVLVRPENVRVLLPDSSDPAGENVVPGLVETITFMGSLTRLTVSAGTERLVCDVPAAAEHFSHGQAVKLAFPPHHCQTMAT